MSKRDDNITIKWRMRGDGMAIANIYENGEYVDTEEYSLGELVYSDVIDLPCGCTVEPDGRCYHGNRSPLLVFGLI